MADDGMVNVGQLARERYGERGGGAGRLRLAPRQRDRRRRVGRADGADAGPARLGRGAGRTCCTAPAGDAAAPLRLASLDAAWFEPRGHRAIGVVYHPESERYGNYVPTVLPRRYDAFLFLDRTEALRPLHLREPALDEVAQTYPSGV